MISREHQIKFMTESAKRRQEKIERWRKYKGLFALLSEEQKVAALNMPDHVIGAMDDNS